MVVEYRVRETKRYVVTRYEGDGTCGACTQVGEYSSGETAYQVGYAMCRQEHTISGEPAESMNFIYPAIPDGVNVDP